MARSVPASAVAAAAILVAAVLVGVLVFQDEGGCERTGYPGTPECVAHEYVARTDASKCRFVAQSLLERLTRARGEAALERCERFASQRPAPSTVRILERETISGTVVVELVTDGREGSLSLRKGPDGRWRIVSFAE